ncbi:MAG: hypothetical protein OEZ65_00430 [Gemmatimonadota bacterium]|nr:hypothetical protein [Gemmatimonadota bacterium]MDH5758019.1 hypothetical protein [Gemmatimonadota bacterium]
MSSAPGFHLATVAHDGRLWVVYLETVDDPKRPDLCRARLRFDPADASGDFAPTQTAAIIIEDSFDEAVARARTFDEQQLAGLLRSTLP